MMGTGGPTGPPMSGCVSYGKSGREYSEWVERVGCGDPDPIPRRLRPTRWNTQACFPDPSWPFLTPTQKDPSAWCLRGLIGCYVREISEHNLRGTYAVNSDLGFVGCWWRTQRWHVSWGLTHWSDNGHRWWSCLPWGLKAFSSRSGKGVWS